MPGPGNPDSSLLYGVAGDIPVIGDWYNSGINNVGVFRSAYTPFNPGPSPQWILSYPQMVPRESPRQKTINERKHDTSRSLGKAALVAQVAPIFFEQRLSWRWNCFDGALGRDAFLAQKVE
jgi:hypothetical protein